MAKAPQEGDVDFMYRSLKLAALWIAIMVVAGVALILYGDALMELFT